MAIHVRLLLRVQMSLTSSHWLRDQYSGRCSIMHYPALLFILDIPTLHSDVSRSSGDGTDVQWIPDTGGQFVNPLFAHDLFSMAQSILIPLQHFNNFEPRFLFFFSMQLFKHHTTRLSYLQSYGDHEFVVAITIIVPV